MPAEDHDSRLDRAHEGDRDAVRELLIEQIPAVEAYVRLRAGAAIQARESISDVVQSVCLQALGDLDRNFEFRSPSAFRGWLFTHALHKIINKARFHQAERRDVAREAHSSATETSPGGPDGLLMQYATIATPSRYAQAKEAIERFEAAFAELEPQYQEAILLHRLGGLPHAEIAEQMGKSEGAVRNLVYRGLAKLSERLRPGDDSSPGTAR